MARRIRANTKADSDLIGNNFINLSSRTIFSFGDFRFDTNFDSVEIDTSSVQLSSFSKPQTLDSLQISESESPLLQLLSNEVTLNNNPRDIRNFANYGSSKEYFRVSLNNIIKNFPASLFISSNVDQGGNITLLDYNYDPIENVSTFKIPSAFVINNFGIVFDFGNTNEPNNNPLKNINNNFLDFVVWRSDKPLENDYNILGFTGDSISNAFLSLKVKGDVFPELSSTSTQITDIDFHLKPAPKFFNAFKRSLSKFEQHIIKKRKPDNSGFITTLTDLILAEESHDISFIDKNYSWPTGDNYNIDISNGRFIRFTNDLLAIGEKYDNYLTDILYRLYTPNSIKQYDLTEEQKVEKLLRIYGRSFDDIRAYVRGLITLNKLSYDKKDNIPDVLVKNFARTLGWDTFSILSEEEFISELTDINKREIEDDILLPSEIDIELWRRICINTAYIWKSRGTRKALETLFLMVGIPEPFINISEYVYLVDKPINPDNVNLEIEDLQSSTFPYDKNGYPKAPVPTPNFYFQISGKTDNGQAYMDNFRTVGFDLQSTVDNKKSWVEAGAIERVHTSTPRYFQNDSRLVLNTKEIGVTLDAARGLEYDIFEYNKFKDFPVTSTGVTQPYVYINIPLEYNNTATTFTLPETPLGDVQVNFNGLVLQRGNNNSEGDYYMLDETTFQLNNQVAQTYSTGVKDVIKVTYMNDRLNGLFADLSNVEYVITSLQSSTNGTIIDIPDTHKGDIQLSINGITLTKSTSLLTGDYIINPNNNSQIIVQNEQLKSYLQQYPFVNIAYIKPSISNEPIEKRSEVYRVDSLQGPKVTFNAGINKYIYKMDFAAYDVDSIKVTINGQTLTNTKDFQLNPNNKSEVYLPNVLSFGDVIVVYYVVADSSFTPPLIPEGFEIPPIGDLSFLEYLEFIYTKLINVKNRKTITDFKGGFYPSILKVYEDYYRRRVLEDDNFLKSNGYTYEDMFRFVNKYNGIFTRFIDKLLPSTIIPRKRGITIRNTAFTKQKFAYKIGVSFDEQLEYLGDAGSLFKKRVPELDIEWKDDFECIVPYKNITNASWEEDFVCITTPYYSNSATSISTPIGYELLN